MSEYYSNIYPYDSCWPDGVVCPKCNKPVRRYFYNTVVGKSYVDKCYQCDGETIYFPEGSK